MKFVKIWYGPTFWTVNSLKYATDAMFLSQADAYEIKK